MIIGLEWIILILGIIAIIGLLTTLIFCWVDFKSEIPATISAIITLITIISFIGFVIPVLLGKSKVEKEYHKYVELRLTYLEAEGIEKEYLEMTDIMTYNIWYENNKDKLEDEWSLWGCSDFADKFAPIEIKE